MSKLHICLSFIVYLVFQLVTFPSDIQAKTTETSLSTITCDIMEMENALIANNSALKPLVDKFTLRSILQEIKEKKCMTYKGNLKVNSEGAKENGFNEFVRTNDLDNLKQLENIQGSVELELSKYPDITNLSFFENVKWINGTKQTPVTFSIMNSNITSLYPPMYTLGIFVTTMEFINNTQLCYLDLFRENIVTGVTISGNRNSTVCKQEGKVCYAGCDGCYGPGKDICLACKYSDGYWEKTHGFYSTCTKCDPGCTTCSGPGNSYPTCLCKFRKYNGKCLPSPNCPNATRPILSDTCKACAYGQDPPVYNITKAGFITCEECSIYCSEGCSGNSQKDCDRCASDVYKYFYEKDKFECLALCPGWPSKSYHKDIVTGEKVCDQAKAIQAMPVLIIIAISALTSKMAYW